MNRQCREIVPLLKEFYEKYCGYTITRFRIVFNFFQFEACKFSICTVGWAVGKRSANACSAFRISAGQGLRDKGKPPLAFGTELRVPAWAQAYEYSIFFQNVGPEFSKKKNLNLR